MVEKNNNDREYIKKQLKLAKKLENDKEYLDNYFGFSVPDYVIMGLIEHIHYDKFCLYVNASKINERITQKQAEQITSVIKYLCHIKNGFNRVSDDFIEELYNNPESPDFIEWKYKYYNVEKIDITKYFSEEELNILKRLDIKILNKIYTEYEYDLLEMDILAYYQDEDDDECPELQEFQKDINNVGVSQEEYDKVLRKLSKIEV